MRALALCSILLAASPALASGGTEVIVFGGGWGPEGTQVSIETQFQALSEALAPTSPRLLFASGDRERRTVQVASTELDPASELLGLVFDRTRDLHVVYRSTAVRASGAATRAQLLASLAEARRGAKTAAVIFGVGHGAPATDEGPAALDLWGADGVLDVTSLAQALDAGETTALTAFVLGQCHSGAFADLAYVGGQAKAGLASPARCVFAAVPREREAAGCTADLNDPDARAYMALIAEALRHPERADADRNGHVSLVEAHQWARLVDETVNVPVSTSELWLEAQRSPASKEDPTKLDAKQLLQTARPAERALLTELLAKLSASSSPRELGESMRQLEARAVQLRDEIDAMAEEREKLRRALEDQVLSRWPELVNPFHRESRRLLAQASATLAPAIEKMDELRSLREADRTVAAKDDELLVVQRRLAQHERWMRTARFVLTERRLRKRGSKARLEELDRLLECEAIEPLAER